MIRRVAAICARTSFLDRGFRDIGRQRQMSGFLMEALDIALRGRATRHCAYWRPNIWR